MTGIAIGGLDFPKIGLGDTEVVKVSLGDVLVWPAKATELNYHDVKESMTYQFTIPSDWQVGDLMLLLNRATGASLPSMPALPGWSVVSNNVIGNVRQASWYRILQAGDAGSTISTIDGTQGKGAILYCFRGVGGVVSNVTVTSYNEEATNGNPVAQVHTVSSYDGLSQLIGFYGASQLPGMNQVMTQNAVSAQDRSDSAGLIYGLIKKLNGGTPITVDMDDASASQVLVSYILTAS